MNHDFLKYIIDFEKTGNLIKSSENLFVSQSALTRALQKLELEVGIPLFNRSKNKIELNETGKLFVEYAKRIIALEKETLDQVKKFHYSSTNLSYGSVAPGPVMKYSNIVYSTFSNTTVSVRVDNEENLFTGLQKDYYDFIYLDKPINDEEYNSIYLFKEDLFAMIPTSHPLSSSNNQLSFKDLDGHSFIMVRNIGIWEKIVRQNMPNTKFIPQDFELLNESIINSSIPNFVTNVSSPLLKVSKDRLIFPLSDIEAHLDYYLVYKKSNENKIKDLFPKL